VPALGAAVFEGAALEYEWSVRVKNRSGKAAARLYLKFKQTRSGNLFIVSHPAERSSNSRKVVLVSKGPKDNEISLLSKEDLIAPEEELRFSVLSTSDSLEFELGRWTLARDAFSDEKEIGVGLDDVCLERRDFTLATPKLAVPLISVPALVIAAAIMGVLGSAGLITSYSSNSRESRKVTVPPTTADLEKPLTKAVSEVRPKFLPPDPGSAGPPQPFPNNFLASAIASKLKNYPTEYNKPGTLLLGESTPVELVIKTNEKQDTAPFFKDLEGEIKKTTVLVASDMSAELTGPPDRLQITLRGDKMRTILSPVPVTWIWDVKPLKPGKAEVTLEVTSYIKSGKDKEPVPIRVLQDTWLVDARGLEWAKYQIEQIEPIQAFIVALGSMVVAVLAWFGIKGWGRKPDFES
jgi:hypothetical protein